MSPLRMINKKKKFKNLDIPDAKHRGMATQPSANLVLRVDDPRCHINKTNTNTARPTATLLSIWLSSQLSLSAVIHSMVTK